MTNKSSSSQWQDLSQPQVTNNRHLENIKTHLDLILLALEAIANINSETILVAAKDLKLESLLRDRITLWRLRAANPQRKTTGGRKRLDVEEARALVLIICYLAQERQELLRRAVTLLEQVTAQNQPAYEVSLLGNYLDSFINCYQERIAIERQLNTQQLIPLAWNLLISLLFYSSSNGHRLLWAAIFDATQNSFPTK